MSCLLCENGNLCERSDSKEVKDRQRVIQLFSSDISPDGKWTSVILRHSALLSTALDYIFICAFYCVMVVPVCILHRTAAGRKEAMVMFCFHPQKQSTEQHMAEFLCHNDAR